MAERVGEEGDSPPGVHLNRPFGPRAGRFGARDRGLQIVDDEVEMNRRPVARVAAPRDVGGS